MTKLIAAKFELRAEIGRGPHGVVWRARHHRTGDEFAVKVLHERFASDDAVVARFARAESILTAFLHPAYVRVREIVIDPQHLALVTEFVDGDDLRQRLAASGRLTPRLAAVITAGAAAAVAAAHEAGVVHCNLKPGNVILTGDATRVRITDCRVARLARGFNDTDDDVYAAPEVHSGGAPVRATDVYGLGLILYEALTATAAQTVVDRAPNLVLAGVVEPRLRETLEQCLAPNPEDRTTAAQLAVDLRQLAELPESVLDQPGPNSDRPVSVAILGAPGRPDDARPSPITTDLDVRQIQAQPSRGRFPTRMLLAGTTLVLLAITATIIAMRMADGAPDRAVSVPPDGPRAIAPRSSEAAPELPSAAMDRSADGAAAFAYHWFDTLNFAVRTGDDSAFRVASGPGCIPCMVVSTSIHDGYQDGRSMEGGSYSVRSVQADSFFDLARPVLRVVYDRTTRSTVDGDGQVVATLPGITFVSCQIVLERSDTQWRVLEVQAGTPIV